MKGGAVWETSRTCYCVAHALLGVILCPCSLVVVIVDVVDAVVTNTSHQICSFEIFLFVLNESAAVASEK